jgi:hypothetical protein
MSQQLGPVMTQAVQDARSIIEHINELTSRKSTDPKVIKKYWLVLRDHCNEQINPLLRKP